MATVSGCPGEEQSDKVRCDAGARKREEPGEPRAGSGGFTRSPCGGAAWPHKLLDRANREIQLQMASRVLGDSGRVHSDKSQEF